MYGTIVSYQAYLDMKTLYVVDDVLKGDDGIQGIFTGRDKEFMIIGQVLETVEKQGDAEIIPELNPAQINIVQGMVNKKYGIVGDFHYYFIKK